MTILAAFTDKGLASEEGAGELPPDSVAPIPPPAEPLAGQNPEGCLHIAADVDWRRWRYCQRPVHRGVWCAAHYAAVHRWPGVEARRRRGEEMLRILAEGAAADDAI